MSEENIIDQMTDAIDSEFNELRAEILRLRAENEKLRAELQKDFNAMRVFERYRELEAEIEKLRAALEAERERCYLAAVSTTCNVEETADYYSGYCDGVQDAAAALKETGDE